MEALFQRIESLGNQDQLKTFLDDLATNGWLEMYPDLLKGMMLRLYPLALSDQAARNLLLNVYKLI